VHAESVVTLAKENSSHGIASRTIADFIVDIGWSFGRFCSRLEMLALVGRRFVGAVRLR